MRIRNTAMLIGAVVALVFLLAAGEQPTAKIGVINVQGAIASTKDGLAASKALQDKFNPKKAQFESQQKQINTLQAELDNPKTSADRKADLTRQVARDKRNFQADVDDANAELTESRQKTLAGMSKRFSDVVQKFGKDNGYSVILDMSGQNNPVVFAASSSDVTSQIVDLYNKSASSGTVWRGDGTWTNPAGSGSGAAAPVKK